MLYLRPQSLARLEAQQNRAKEANAKALEAESTAEGVTGSQLEVGSGYFLSSDDQFGNRICSQSLKIKLSCNVLT